MPWYAVYRKSDHALVSVGTIVADPLDPSYEAKELSGQPDFSTHQWDPVTLDFVPMSPPTVIEKLDFIRRFTATEKQRLASVDSLSISDKAKRDIKNFLNYLTLSEFIDKTDSLIVSALNIMESSGIIGSGRKSAILS